MSLSTVMTAIGIVFVILVVLTLATMFTLASMWAWDKGGADGGTLLASLKTVPIPTTDLSGSLNSSPQAKGQMHLGADGKYPAYNTNYTPAAEDYPYQNSLVNDRNSHVID
jgi:hypothetical protein